ncbi:MAG: GTP 3',8-cyclase MoaA [Anaerolineae bacterium]|jgi:cyclic pyranopterin phosphate synthase|nr:GTP 3',8-cyclase MoaA [Anaerolineae bacterium]
MLLHDTFQRPLRDLRISVTDRCNFRCTYCMPAEVFGEAYQFLPRAELLTFEEITRIARLMVRLGVVKLRLTGGEPLVRQELERLIALLVQIEGVEDIALTTNAYFLPQKAQALKDAGLHRLTVSLDTLDEAIFQRMNGRRSTVARVLAGIEAAQRAGFERIKINAVVQRGVNDDALVDLARWAKAAGHIMRFIEYMDVGTLNGWRMDDVVPAKEIIARIHAAMPVEPAEQNYYGEVAERWRYVDGSGEFGVIASVTQPFCGTCTRLRLSPEGRLFTCLFGSQGTDLRTALRDGADDAALEDIVRRVWRVRADRYSEIRTSLTGPVPNRVQMYHIGG